MPGKYYYDEEHISEWLKASKTDEGTKDYLDKYVYGVEDFNGYLEAVGGMRKFEYLTKVEQLRAEPVIHG